MIRRSAVILLLLGLGFIFLQLWQDYAPDQHLNLTAHYYAEQSASEVGVTNLLAGILVAYRGLDTLGEVTVLFLAAAIVGLVLARGRKKADSGRERPPSGELLGTGMQLLVPLVLLLGVYVVAHGHLTPGGGFQGGAILASATLLMLLTNPVRRFSHSLISAIESTAGIAFVLLGCFGVLLAGGFLDNRFLPLGDLGHLFSAGAIPVIYAFIGLKVGAEFSSMLADLSETEDS